MLKRTLRHFGKVLTAGVAIAVGTLWWAGHVLSEPHNHPIGSPPSELAAQTVEFSGVHGWFTSVGDNRNCALLLHGVRADRRAMIARALFLKRLGYASLLIDMQAHGETPGEYIACIGKRQEIKIYG